MRAVALLLAGAPFLLGAVEGTVRNGTTGQPQAGVEVVLVAMGGQGMAPRATVKSDASGAFRFADTVQGAALVQGSYGGVQYNLILGSGAPTTGLTLDVFEVSAKPGAAKVVEDVVLLEPSGSQLVVRQNVIWQNTGKETYRDPAGGTLRFAAPPEAKDTLRVLATAPGGLPLEQSAAPAGAAGVYKVDFAIKPGETTFEVSYHVPFTAPGSFTGRTVQKDAPLRLAVPSGVALKGEGVSLLGQEPQSRASIYGVAGQEFSVSIEGTGAMGAGAATGEEAADSGFAQILPRVYDNVTAIVALGMAILALGFALLFRRTANPAAPATPPASPSGRRRK